MNPNPNINNVINESPALYVRRIKIQGLNRINGNVVLNEFNNVYSAKDIINIEKEINKSVKDLKSLHLFESIDVQCIDVPEFPFLTDVIINLKEQRMDEIKIKPSFITDNELSVESSASLLSPFGHSEKISAVYKLGQEGSHALSLKYNNPRLLGTVWNMDAYMFKSMKDYQISSSYIESIKGFHASLTNQAGNLKLFYNCDVRDVMPSRGEKLYEYKSSREVLEMGIPSVKSSVGLGYKSDRRDNSIAPTNGSLLEMVSELAGIGGSISFAKLACSWQKYVELGSSSNDANKVDEEEGNGLDILNSSNNKENDNSSKLFRIPGLVGGFSFNAGVIFPFERIPIIPTLLFGQSTMSPPLIVETKVNDRFFLGGPQTLRGFDFRGAGPMAQRLRGNEISDSVGGDIKWSAGVNLNAPFPHISLAALGVRAHIYGNVGSICGWKDAGFQELFGKGVRISIGAGLVVPTTLGRLEINYSSPIQYNKFGDRINRFQVSISKDFL